MKSLAHLLCIVALLFAGCSKPRESVSETKPSDPMFGTLAPSWQLKDVKGNVVSSEQFKGKVMVVDFWATWCPPCREELPGYVELQKKYAKDGLVIVGISLDEGDPNVVKEFIEKNGVDYQIVIGNESVVGAFGGVEGIPTTFVIDRAGKIRDKKVGAEPKEEFEKRMLAVLK